ncbi:MAG: amino acid permease [Elusimicrobia bacterium]|nr:amino acid permease [Elusimicrobiota bacterium]
MAQEHSQRPLTFLDMTCVGVNAIVGSSIFLFPGKLAAFLGPASVLSFAFTGLLLSSVALCFAEAASRYERPGGAYLYTRDAFGDWAGYGVGWMCWVTQILSWAAVANGIAVYLGYFGPLFTQKWLVKAVAASVILLMGTINYRGVKMGAWTSDFFTMAKLVPLLLFAAVGLARFDASALHPFAPTGLRSMGPACFLAYFAFQGFESIPVPAGEAQNPQRNVPLAVIFSMALATVLYMLVQLAAVGSYPGLAGSERPLAEAAARLLGPVGASVIVAGAVLSMIGYNAGCALGSPRYLVALAQDAHLPPSLGALHERFGTPSKAVAWTAGLSLLAAVLVDFGKLVDVTNIVVCAQYLATCAAVPLLRRGGAGPFQIPGGALVPSLGVAATLWLGAQGGLAEIAWTLGFLSFGLILKLAMKSRVPTEVYS